MESQTYTGKAAEILDAAERRMRGGGFDAVSFRDIAVDVGIKSASVHYHFPHKADLGAAVVHRYRDRLLATLSAPDDPGDTVVDRIGRLCDAYRAAVLDDGMVCLCCVLGAEVLDLPAPVADAVNRFFTRLLSWTDTALKAGPARAAIDEPNAAEIVAGLQGAMILALATKQPSLFTDATDRVLAKVAAHHGDRGRRL